MTAGCHQYLPESIRSRKKRPRSALQDASGSHGRSRSLLANRLEGSVTTMSVRMYMHRKCLITAFSVQRCHGVLYHFDRMLRSAWLTAMHSRPLGQWTTRPQPIASFIKCMCSSDRSYPSEPRVGVGVVILRPGSRERHVPEVSDCLYSLSVGWQAMTRMHAIRSY